MSDVHQRQSERTRPYEEDRLEELERRADQAVQHLWAALNDGDEDLVRRIEQKCDAIEVELAYRADQRRKRDEADGRDLSTPGPLR